MGPARQVQLLSRLATDVDLAERDAAGAGTVTAPSRVRGPSEPPLLEETVGSVLRRTAAAFPHAEALISVEQEIRWTFAEFDRRVDALAAGLLALGLKQGDRLGIWAPNCAEWALIQFATARTGIIQVNINPAYRLEELEYTLRKVGVKALVCAESFKTSDYLAMLETLTPELKSGGTPARERLPELEIVAKLGSTPRDGWLLFDEIKGIWDAELEEASSRLLPQQPINIQFTSGTTGSPKGATLSHRNIVNNAWFVGLAAGMRAGDRLCVPVPLYHCFGMVMANLACVLHGATVVYPSAGFDAGAVLRAIENERCSLLYGVPTMFMSELEHPDFESRDLSSLRGGIMAGSPCPIEVMRKVVDRMHMPEVTIAYGMTETSPVSFQSGTADPLERRVSTVGRIHPHVEAKVVDAEGNARPHNEKGELCTRGYSVMLGYWDDPERTAEAIDGEGWMHTGDLAVIDEEGYCKIVGRSKDMIIRGGENIYPREIEEFLFRHPDVEDVAVVGVPHQVYGEEVCVWVRRRPGATIDEEAIRSFCRDKLAHYKIPQHVRFVKEFPTTVTGKVQKYLIRQQMCDELGIAEQEGC